MPFRKYDDDLTWLGGIKWYYEITCTSYFDINTGLTQKIFDFFLESSAKKFIFFSSVKAAADSVVGDMLTEDVVPAPIGPYGESKIAAEDLSLIHI